MSYTGPSGVAPPIGHISSIPFYCFCDLIGCAFDLGVCLEWAVVAAMRYHQFESANGISTLALLRVPCHIPYRAFYEFVLCRTYGVLPEYPTGLVELKVSV